MNTTLTQQVKVVTGAGCISRLGEIVKESGYKKAFIVTTAGMVKRGQIARIIKILADAGIDSVVYDKTQPDPPSNLVDEGAKLCKEQNCDCVIAFGGGSTIDMAKGINILRFNEGTILDYTSKPMEICHGLITIPTTSGTGSELSNGAIITDINSGQKLPVLCLNCMSEFAVLDPELTISMPANVTRETGLDTFSHAVEAYTSTLSNSITGIVCEGVMENIVSYLKRACENGNDMDAREKLQSAAALGGWMLYHACAHVGHSFAHVTGATLHIIHGDACAYGLPGVLKLISTAVPEKIKRIGKILGATFDGSETAEQIGQKTADAYIAFSASVGFKRTPISLSEEQLNDMAHGIEKELFAGLSPVKITQENALSLLKEAFSS